MDTQIKTHNIFISASEAQALVGKVNVRFIDVRPNEEYKASHIPEAVNINEIFSYLGLSSKEGIENIKKDLGELFKAKGVNSEDYVIIYEDCLKTYFGASCRGYFLFQLLGHSKVSIIKGGWEAWIKIKAPTSNELTKISSGNFKPGWNDSMWSGQSDIEKALKTGNAKLLDVRDIDEWTGESSSPYGKDFVPRKGRLPNAIYILWTDFMKLEDGLTVIKSPEEVRKLCEAKNITPEDNIIVYCFKGARASNTLLALKESGFKNVTNYFASWNEWSKDFSLPIDEKKLIL